MDALNLEAQIFGKLDMATDVKEVAVAPYVSDKVKKNVKAFCKKHLIGYVSVAEDAPKLLNAKMGGLSSDDVVKVARHDGPDHVARQRPRHRPVSVSRTLAGESAAPSIAGKAARPGRERRSAPGAQIASQDNSASSSGGRSESAFRANPGCSGAAPRNCVGPTARC